MRRNKSATLRGDRFWQIFFCQNRYPWGTDFGKWGPFLAAKIGPAGPILAAKVVRRGTGFGRFFCQNQSGRTNFRGDRFWRDRPIAQAMVVSGSARLIQTLIRLALINT